MTPSDSANAAPGSPPLPASIDGYDIVRVLGSGGMATVYAALQKQPRRTVALKLMRGGIDAPTALRRFRREIEILGRLKHSYIAQVYDAGMHVEGGVELPYFVMEYVSGGRNILEHVAARDLDLRDRLKLFAKVCAAIEHGHRNKVIHRDLKPGNILIDAAGDPKVIDFGVARAIEMDVSAQTMTTEAGRLVGTIQYMAPEQVDTTLRDIDARCDVYALGVLLYKLCTGQFPYDLQGLPVYIAAQAVREEMPRPPSALRPELKGDLETIIRKALEKDRTRRYRNAGSLGRDVVRFLASKPIHAKRATLAHRAHLFIKRHKVALATAAVVLVIVGIAAGYGLYERARARTIRDSAAALVEAQRRERETMTTTAPPAAEVEPALPEPIVLSEQVGRITALAFDSAGGRLVSGSHDYSVAMWDVAAQRMLRLDDEHEGAVRHAVFSADGRRLVTAGEDDAILVRDAVTGEVVNTVRHPCATIHALAVNADGSVIAFGCEDLTLRIVNLATGETDLRRSTTGAFHAIAFAPDGKVAAGSERGTILLWSEGESADTGRFDALGGCVIALAFDDNRLIAAAAGGDAVVFDMTTGEAVSRARLEPAGATRAVIEPRAGRLLIASRETAVLHDLDDLAPIGDPIVPDDAIYAIALDPAGRWLALGHLNGTIHLHPIPNAPPSLEGRGPGGGSP